LQLRGRGAQRRLVQRRPGRGPRRRRGAACRGRCRPDRLAASPPGLLLPRPGRGPGASPPPRSAPGRCGGGPPRPLRLGLRRDHASAAGRGGGGPRPVLSARSARCPGGELWRSGERHDRRRRRSLPGRTRGRRGRGGARRPLNAGDERGSRSPHLTTRRRAALLEGFTLLAGVFDPAASAAHLAALVDELDWETQQFAIYGRTVPMPRLIAMYGPVGYRYSGVVHPPRALPPRLESIGRCVAAVTDRAFNSVLANLYRDGRDSVGWHRDSDYAHGGQPDIASVSFGATRSFELRDADGRERFALELESGSVLLMTGAAVARWWHRVPKTRTAGGPRVNLTFRYMVADA